MAKSFIKNLGNCIYQEFQETVPPNQLKEAFQDAIAKLPKGRLQKDLEGNFDKHLTRLERKLHKLSQTRVTPSLIDGQQDGLQDLYVLENRKDATEHRQNEKLVYNLLVQDPSVPDEELMKEYTDEEKKRTYVFYLRRALSRPDVSSKKLKTVLKRLDEVISKPSSGDKSKFDWLPVISHLLNLSVGTSTYSIIRVLEMLFGKAEKDINSCLQKGKVVRAGRLAEILKKILTCFHMRLNRGKLQKQETKKYVSLMSAMLSLYVDLCCLHSSKLEKKRVYGRQICGFVCYILQPWPESVCEVVLQLSMVDADCADVLLPLISKSLSTKPDGENHLHYLKYVLIVRMAKKNWPQCDQVIEWVVLTKNVPAEEGFIDWLQQQCLESLEHLPVKDRKLKKTKVTKYLLNKADNNLIKLLLESLHKGDTSSEEDILEQYTYQEAGGEEQTPSGVTTATEELFYLDTIGLASVAETESEKTKETFENQPSTSKKSSHEPVMLNSLEDLQHIVDNKMNEGQNSPQTYRIDPALVSERFEDPETRKFLESDIISITSVSPNKVSLSEEEASEEEVGKYSRGRKTKKNIFASETESDASMLEQSKDVKRMKSVVYRVSSDNVNNIELNTNVSETDQSELEFDQSKSSIPVTDQSNVSSSCFSTSQTETTVIIEDSDVDESEVKSVLNSQTELTAESTDQLVSGNNKAATESDVILESDLESSETEDEMTFKKSPLETVIKSPDKRVLSDNNATESVNILESDLESPETDDEVIFKETHLTQIEKTPDKKDKCGRNQKKMSDSKSEIKSMDKSSITASVMELQRCSVESLNSSYEESEMNKTAKYVGGKPLDSPRKHSNKSDISNVAPKKSAELSPRKSPRKTSMSESSKSSDKNDSLQNEDQESNITSPKSTDDILKNPRKSKKTPEKHEPEKEKRKSEMHLHISADEESEGDVFAKSSKTKHSSKKSSVAGGTTPTSIEEKFIVKANKRKLHMKKLDLKTVAKTDNSEISGSVSMFSDDESVINKHETNVLEITGDTKNMPKTRSKSVEEIMGIVEEVKQKIKNPKKRASKQKDESVLFTDDSIESVDSEKVESDEKSRTPRKRRCNTEMDDKETNKSGGESKKETPKVKSTKDHDEEDVDLFAKDSQDYENDKQKTSDNDDEVVVMEKKRKSSKNEPEKNTDASILKETKMKTPKKDKFEQKQDTKSIEKKVQSSTKISQPTTTEGNNVDNDGRNTKVEKLSPQKMSDVLTEVKIGFNDDDDDFVEQNKENRRKTPNKKSNETFEIESTDESDSEIKIEFQDIDTKSPKSAEKQNKVNSLEFITSPPKSASKPKTPLSSAKKLKTPKSSEKLKSLQKSKGKESAKKIPSEKEKELVVCSSQEIPGNMSAMVPDLTSPELKHSESGTEKDKAGILNIGEHLKNIGTNKETFNVSERDTFSKSLCTLSKSAEKQKRRNSLECITLPPKCASKSKTSQSSAKKLKTLKSMEKLKSLPKSNEKGSVKKLQSEEEIELVVPSSQSEIQSSESETEKEQTDLPNIGKHLKNIDTNEDTSNIPDIDNISKSPCTPSKSAEKQKRNSLEFITSPPESASKLKTPQSSAKKPKTPKSEAEKDKAVMANIVKDVETDKETSNIPDIDNISKSPCTPSKSAEKQKKRNSLEFITSPPKSASKLKTPQSSAKKPKTPKSKTEKDNAVMPNIVKDVETDKETSDISDIDNISKSPCTPSKSAEKKRNSIECITTPPKSVSKPKTPQSSAKKLKIPKSREKLKSLPKSTEKGSARKLQSEEETELVVPSSQKRSGASSAKVLQLTSPEFQRLQSEIQSSESETEKEQTGIPNIGKYLKNVDTDKEILNIPDRASMSKSPRIPSTSEVAPLKNIENKDTADVGYKPDSSPKTRRHSLRPRSALELTDIDTDSDVVGPTQTKRLRSTTKIKPTEAPELKPVAKTGVLSKKDLNKLYEFPSESKSESKVTRKSVGGRKMTTIKEKEPNIELKVGIPEPRTPQAKPKERKVSASTSKKVVKKVEELSGRRKRRLSGELSASDKGSASGGSDSEVSFPKLKKPQVSSAAAKPETKTSKRLSAPPAAVKLPVDETPSSSGRRYSLRKK